MSTERSKLDLSELDDILQDSIRKGLEKGDANMVKAYVEIRDRETVTDILKDLTIEIVDYRIKDTSLRKIVLEAPDYVIEEIQEALKERRHIAEFGAEGRNEST